MINKAPTPVNEYNNTVVKTTEPIYDTYKGTPTYIPVGYAVKIISATTQTGWAVIQTFDSKGRRVRVNAELSQLDLPNNKGPVGPAAAADEPLTPRIYQEYGITFLHYKTKAELADAPGVGKTIQALEAAMRVMQAFIGKYDPLELDYTREFTESELEINTHPVTRPEWAEPKPRFTQTTHNFGAKTELTVSTHTPYYWPEHLNPVTVIVAPSHLCNMWFKAIRRQYPNEHVAVATNDTRANRLAVLAPGCRFYVVNYEMMREAKEPPESAYEEVPVHVQGLTIKEKRLKASYKPPVTYLDMLNTLAPVCVIFDEAHRLKSVKSKQARAAAEFAHKAQYVFELTATPIKREADDLFMQLHIIDPGNFYKDEYGNFRMNAFLNRYCFYKQTSYGKSNIQLTDRAKRRLWFNRIEALESQTYDSFGLTTKKTNKAYNTSFTDPNLQGYILGRSYKDVGLYLPPVIPATIPVNMDTNIREIYENLKKTYRATFVELGETLEVSSMIGMLHSLRILTACPNKYEAVKQLIEDNEGPFVIYCEYKPSGEFLAQYLDTEFISGETPESERETRITDLLRQGKPIVGMGRVIGTGINALNACNTIINFENDYTPGERTQRIGRVQRFNPDRPVGEPILLFDVIVVESIDEHVYEVQRNRGKSIRDIIAVELGIK